ncbi:MAG TPA: hypothetical protein PK256_10380 [Verrucomicrobiota bacterium]|nr:hypothetical protein [Verrucomicrobiota bacterium]
MSEILRQPARRDKSRAPFQPERGIHSAERFCQQESSGLIRVYWRLFAVLFFRSLLCAVLGSARLDHRGISAASDWRPGVRLWAQSRSRYSTVGHDMFSVILLNSGPEFRERMTLEKWRHRV